MAEVTWLGDEDPSVQVIEQYGHTFVKGQPTTVPDRHPQMGKFRNSNVFSVDEKAEPIDSKEPEPVDPDEGTELAAVKAELHRRGISFGPNSKLDTLRKKLADAAE